MLPPMAFSIASTGKCYPYVRGIIINTENEYPLNATGPCIVYERDQLRGRLHNGRRRYTRMHARTMQAPPYECVVELVLWFHRLIPVKRQSTDVILHLACGVFLRF